jgi:hypothetical protein
MGLCNTPLHLEILYIYSQDEFKGEGIIFNTVSRRQKLALEVFFCCLLGILTVIVRDFIWKHNMWRTMEKVGWPLLIFLVPCSIVVFFLLIFIWSWKSCHIQEDVLLKGLFVSFFVLSALTILFVGFNLYVFGCKEKYLTLSVIFLSALGISCGINFTRLFC